MVITATSENRSIVDLEPVLIHFIREKIAQRLRLWSVGCRQRPEGNRCLEKHSHRKHQVLIKGCLEPPYLLTARVFSIYVPQLQGIKEMECLSSRTECLLLHPIQQTTSSLSFFLVLRAKHPRHANDHARDWRRETGVSWLRHSTLACTPLTKSDDTRQGRWRAWQSLSENRSFIWIIQESRRGIATISL